MRRTIGALAAMAILLSAGSAFAQDEPKTKFYDFDDMLIDGQLKIPEGMTTQAREKASFRRLLNLKKSFLPRVRETAEEAALQ